MAFAELPPPTNEEFTHILQRFHEEAAPSQEEMKYSNNPSQASIRTRV